MLLLLAFTLINSNAFAADPPDLAVALSTVALDESTLRVHFIDIGPDLAMLIETPGGHQYNHPQTETIQRIRKTGIGNDHVLRTDYGDSTPKTNVRDPKGDDSFILVTNGDEITSIVRVKVE
jgi:hypothetical protein